eukprot:1150444-Pelagomonas_calceolata.AAC.1
MEQPILQQASVQDVSDFRLQHNNKLFSFVSELMDIMLTGENQSQADQPNSLAEGPPYKSKPKIFLCNLANTEQGRHRDVSDQKIRLCTFLPLFSILNCHTYMIVFLHEEKSLPTVARLQWHREALFGEVGSENVRPAQLLHIYE